MMGFSSQRARCKQLPRRLPRLAAAQLPFGSHRGELIADKSTAQLVGLVGALRDPHRRHRHPLAQRLIQSVDNEFVRREAGQPRVSRAAFRVSIEEARALLDEGRIPFGLHARRVIAEVPSPQLSAFLNAYRNPKRRSHHELAPRAVEQVAAELRRRRLVERAAPSATTLEEARALLDEGLVPFGRNKGKAFTELADLQLNGLVGVYSDAHRTNPHPLEPEVADRAAAELARRKADRRSGGQSAGT